MRREAVVSLDASRTPAMLFDVGIGSSFAAAVFEIFSICFPSRRFLLYIERKISRGSPEPPWRRNPPVGYRHCYVPVDSPNVPKSTSRRFRHFMQLLRGFHEVKKNKKILRNEATNTSCTVSIRIMFSSVHDAKTNARRVVKEFEVDRMEPITNIGSRTSL